MSYEAAINRDYPVVFGTLFIFTLLGLVVKLIGDLSLHPGRSAHRLRQPRSLELNLSPLNRRRFERFKTNKRGWWSLWLFLGPVRAEPGRRADRQRQTAGGALSTTAGTSRRSSATRKPHFGGELPLQANYKSPYIRELLKAKDAWVLWAPIPFSYQSINYDLKVPAPRPPSTRQPAGHRRPGPRRVGAGDLRLPGFGAVCPDADRSQLDHRRRSPARCRAIYGGWVDLAGQRFLEIWSGLPVLYLLIILASFVAAEFLVAAGDHAAVFLDEPGGRGARRVPARAQPGIRAAARALGMQNGAIMFRHILPNAMISTMTFMPFILTGAIGTLTALDFLGFGMPAGSAVAG